MPSVPATREEITALHLMWMWSHTVQEQPYLKSFVTVWLLSELCVCLACFVRVCTYVVWMCHLLTLSLAILEL